MINQFHPPRGRMRTLCAGNREWHGMVGTIPAGAMFRDPEYPGKSPWQIVAWTNREYTAHHRDAAGRWRNVMMAGGHLAITRRLSDGRTGVIADHRLRWLDDNGCVY